MGRGLTPLQRSSGCILQPLPTGQKISCVSIIPAAQLFNGTIGYVLAVTLTLVKNYLLKLAEKLMIIMIQPFWKNIIKDMIWWGQYFTRNCSRDLSLDVHIVWAQMEQKKGKLCFVVEIVVYFYRCIFYYKSLYFKSSILKNKYNLISQLILLPTVGLMYH